MLKISILDMGLKINNLRVQPHVTSELIHAFFPLSSEEVIGTTIFSVVALFLTLLIFMGRICFGWFRGFSPITYKVSVPGGPASNGYLVITDSPRIWHAAACRLPRDVTSWHHARCWLQTCLTAAESSLIVELMNSKSCLIIWKSFLRTY